MASEVQTHYGPDDGVLDDSGLGLQKGLGRPLEGLLGQGLVQVPGQHERLEVVPEEA